MKKCDGDSQAFLRRQLMIINRYNFKFLISSLFYISFFLSFSYQLASAQDNQTDKSVVFENSLEEVLGQIERNYSVRIFYKSEDLPNESVKIVLSDSSIVDGINEGLKQFDLKIIEYNNQIFVIGKKNLMEEVATSDFYEKIAIAGKVLTGMSQADNKELIVVGDKNNISLSGRGLINGLIVDQNTGEPIIGCLVSFAEVDDKAISDIEGRFQIRLPIGAYDLYLKSVGYADVVKKVILKGDGDFFANMSDQLTTLDEIVVYGDQEGNMVRRREVLSQLQMKELPAFLGEPDIIKSILVLPGISSVGDGAAGFNVRGGNSDENLVLMNDIMLFNTSHALGFFGAINSDAISKVSLYKGDMPADFGGRLSSVLDIQLKEANNEKFSIKGGLGPFTGNLTMEIPLIKGKSSILVGGRSSYSDWLLNRVNVPDVKKSSLFFYDLNLHYAHQINEKFKLTSTVYLSQDNFGFSDKFGFEYGTQSFAVKLYNLLNRRITSDFSISYSDFKSQKFDYQGSLASIFDSGIEYYKLKERVVFELTNNFILDLGGSFINYESKPGLIRPGNEFSVISSNELKNKSAIELAGFASTVFSINSQVNLSAGIRISNYNLLGPERQFIYNDQSRPSVATMEDTVFFDTGENIISFSNLEPRFSFEWKIGSDIVLSSGYSRAAQYLFQISNTANAAPVDVWVLSNRYLLPPKTHNFSIDITRNKFLNFGIISLGYFYRTSSNLKDYIDFADLIVNEHLETEIINVQGRAYGMEFNLKRNFGNLTGDASYTFSRSQRKTDDALFKNSINVNNWYFSNYDKTHSMTLLSKYKFNNRHSISMNFNYSTGRPATAPIGFFDVEDGTRVPIYSERNQLRIPNYHRLDITYSVAQDYWERKKWKSSWTFGIYNIYGRRNAFSVFFTQSTGSQLQANKFSVLGSAFPAITYNISFSK